LEQAQGKVYIVGAGPGDPDLLTIRGLRIIQEADLVIYADSLVQAAAVGAVKPEVEVIPSASLTLEQVMAKMLAAVQAGRTVVRLHSGDPALYGALYEQLARLEEAQIEYEIVPGVSAVFAAAARLGVELTVPGIAQSLILTRMSGKASPVPSAEKLQAMAAHQTSLAIYLSITQCREMVNELLAGGYPPTTPVAVLYQVSWPDEQIIVCELDQLADQVARAGFSRQTLVLVGPALAPALNRKRSIGLRSQLYHPSHSHVFRKGLTNSGEAQKPAETAASPSEKHLENPQTPVRPKSELAIVALTNNGSRLAERLQTGLQVQAGAEHEIKVFAPVRYAGPNSQAYRGKPLELVRELFGRCRQLVLIMPVGVAVRAIGSLAQNKHQDAGVVVVDEAGRFAISFLAGHAGGANRLAEQVSHITGGQAVITTASDVQGLPALDLLGQAEGWKIANIANLTRSSAALVNGHRLVLWQEAGNKEVFSNFQASNLQTVETPEELLDPKIETALLVTYHLPEVFQPEVLSKAVVYHPPVLWLGIGCRRGVNAEKIEQTVKNVLLEHGLAFEAVEGLASANIKKDEPGLLEFAQKYNLRLNFYSGDELNAVAPEKLVSDSASQALLGVQGVAEPAVLLATGAASLLVAKVRDTDVTVAVAVKS
jgi:precorrin-4 C11-methyltransferase